MPALQTFGSPRKYVGSLSLPPWSRPAAQRHGRRCCLIVRRDGKAVRLFTRLDKGQDPDSPAMRRARAGVWWTARLSKHYARLTRMFSERFGWKPIDTAPIDQDVALVVTDGGEPYALHSPFKLTAAGWVSSSKGTPLVVTPLQWRPYLPRPKKR
jgi:hypothetical protein